jgi:hypothetical protein
MVTPATAAIDGWLTSRHRESKNAGDIATASLKFEAYASHLAFKEVEPRDDEPKFLEP